MIKVSIVTPSYNQGLFIEETILSVLNQTYKNIEYILVDGGSTDNTMEIVNRYRDKINIVIHEKDQGQADAINKGFKLAKGELIGWINSDDILYPECVEKIVHLYEEKNDGAVYYCSNLDWINENSEKIKCVNVEIPDRNHLLNNDYTLIQQGSFYQNHLVAKTNYLDINNYYCMDLALWLDLLNHGPIYALKTEFPLAAFRVYIGTKTDTGKTKFLINIKDVLLQKGAKWYSKNIIKHVYVYMFKNTIKTLFH